MWNSAIRRVSVTSLDVHCLRLPRNGGMFRVTPYILNSSCISNPLSAITLSPLSSRSMMPHLLVIALSDTLPPHSSDTNETTPPGVMPTKTLKVL